MHRTPVIALLALAACQIEGTFPCTLDESCGANGRCEPLGYCSFPDGECEGGRRYDELAGEGVAGECVGERCPASYGVTIPGLGSSYRVVAVPSTWTNAQNDCNDDGPGMHLVVIGSEAERAGVGAQTSDDAWIGLSDRVTEGMFRWVTREPATFRAFAGGGPDDPDGTHDCAMQRRMNAMWQDHPCAELFSYVCECDGVASDPAAF